MLKYKIIMVQVFRKILIFLLKGVQCVLYVWKSICIIYGSVLVLSLLIQHFKFYAFLYYVPQVFLLSSYLFRFLPCLCLPHYGDYSVVSSVFESVISPVFKSPSSFMCLSDGFVSLRVSLTQFVFCLLFLFTGYPLCVIPSVMCVNFALQSSTCSVVSMPIWASRRALWLWLSDDSSVVGCVSESDEYQAVVHSFVT